MFMGITEKISSSSAIASTPDKNSTFKDKIITYRLAFTRGYLRKIPTSSNDFIFEVPKSNQSAANFVLTSGGHFLCNFCVMAKSL